MRQVLGKIKHMGRLRKSGVYLFVMLALLTGGIGLWQRQAIYDQMYDWKLIPRPERLTELYFTDHRNLPATYAPGQQQTVKFTVHNLEHRRTTYKYAVVQQTQDSQTETQLAAGTFALSHDQTQAVTTAITPTNHGGRSRITVNLTYNGIAFGEDDPSKQTQSIHYWVTKQGDRQ